MSDEKKTTWVPSAFHFLPMVLAGASGYFFAINGLGWAFLCFLGLVVVEGGMLAYRTELLRHSQAATIRMAREPLLALFILRHQSPQIAEALLQAQTLNRKDHDFSMSWDELMDEIDNLSEK